VINAFGFAFKTGCDSYSANPPCAAILSTVRELCGKAGVNSVTLCHPPPYSLHVAPLEGGQRNPRERYGYLPRARTGRCRDIRPAWRCFLRHLWPCAASPAAVPPSRALQRHPRHCESTRRRDGATPATVRLPTLRQHDPRTNVRTTTEQEAPTPLPSKPLLDGHRTCRGALLEARFARTAIHSVVLYTIPSLVIRTERHDCKPPPLGL
jgi:hypothetical protein